MPRLLLACLAAAVLGCAAEPTTPGPNDAAWTPPPDWTTVASNDGGIRLTLPPWLETFDTSGAIFANERPPAPGADVPMQLMALGPDPQALVGAETTLAGWVEARLENPAKGIPTVTRISLPAGPGIRYDRVDRDATGWSWRFAAFAIETPRGVAYLQLDGPPDAWPSRAADLEKVALLFRVR